MALRAGRVGVSPDIVDNNGFIKNMGGGGEPIDAYTKAETDALLATKADQSNLTANSKDFVFAYSNGQYGYKAGATGAFTPFSRPGWNTPGNLSAEGLIFDSEYLQYISGGYEVISGVVYVDLIYLRKKGGSTSIGGFPAKAGNYSVFGLASLVNTEPDRFDIFYEWRGDITLSTTVVDSSLSFNDGNGNTIYRHLIACYPTPSNREVQEEENSRNLTEEEPSEEIKSTTKKSTRRK